MNDSLPTEQVIHSDPETLGGVPVFVGTRVPVRMLFEHLSAGDTLDDFLDGFPSVSRLQAEGCLREALDATVTASAGWP